MAQPLHILVADDEDANRTEIVRILKQRMKHDFFEAADGEAAIELARRVPFDLLLLDVRMPKRDGIEALREIRKIHPRVACIILTGFAGDEAPIQALKLGARDFLHKPISAADLIGTVEREVKTIQLERKAARMQGLLEDFRRQIESAIELLSSAANLSPSEDPEKLLRHALRVAMRLTAAQGGGIWLAEEGHLALRLAVLPAPREVPAGGDPLASGKGVAGRVFHSGRGIAFQAPPDPELAAEIAGTVEDGWGSVLAVPLSAGEESRGVLEVFSGREARPFGAGDLEALQALSSLVVAALASSRRDRLVSDMLVELLRAIVKHEAERETKTMAREPVEVPRSRPTDLHEAIRPSLEALGVSDSERRAVELAAQISEIGQYGPRPLEFCRQTMEGLLQILRESHGSGFLLGSSSEGLRDACH